MLATGTVRSHLCACPHGSVDHVQDFSGAAESSLHSVRQLRARGHRPQDGARGPLAAASPLLPSRHPNQFS